MYLITPTKYKMIYFENTEAFRGQGSVIIYK